MQYLIGWHQPSFFYFTFNWPLCYKVSLNFGSHSCVLSKWKSNIHFNSIFIEPQWPGPAVQGLFVFAFERRLFHIPDAKKCPDPVIEVWTVQLRNFSHKTPPAHPDPIARFLFSAFICMELVTVSSPTSHAMWNKTSQLLPGRIKKNKKSWLSFFLFPLANDKHCVFLLLTLCWFYFEKVTL